MSTFSQIFRSENFKVSSKLLNASPAPSTPSSASQRGVSSKSTSSSTKKMEIVPIKTRNVRHTLAQAGIPSTIFSSSENQDSSSNDCHTAIADESGSCSSLAKTKTTITCSFRLYKSG